MIAEVLVEIPINGINKTFSYLVPDELRTNIKKGMRVLVPFGNKNIEGFILNINEEVNADFELKNIISISDNEIILNEELLNLGKYICNKTFCSLIKAYQTMLPVGIKASSKKNLNKKYETYIKLNDNIDENAFKGKSLEIIQSIVKNKIVLKKDLKLISASALKTLLDKKILIEIKKEVYRLDEKYDRKDSCITLTDKQKNVVDKVLKKKDEFMPFLLHGITGSGKTEVYINIVKKIVSDGKEAIILVPEISLTPQVISKFKSKFGDIVAVLHSGLSDGEKYDEWRKIIRKEVSIVIGARSAIFAPFENIGAIIIDEEHSDTYKQENTPRYNAIDMALYRAKFHKCPVVLGSATPSIDSYTKAKMGLYELLELNERINKKLPKVTLVDMKNEIESGNKIFSRLLKTKLKECLENDKQAIILLNRRGYATSITCHNCGYKAICPKCEIPLTYHKHSNYLECHYCGYKTYKPAKCPNCNSTDINEFGLGTEKLEEEIVNNFEGVKTIRMDVDTTSRKGSHARIINDFQNKKYNVLIGTQMVAKGLDFENVTLVGVINADASLNIPDYRSAERTFDLLSQVSGRAGRGKLDGEVILQGFNIDHYSIIAASIHDYKAFYNKELQIRKKLDYPPYYNLCLIKTSSKDIDALNNENDKIISYLRNKMKDCIILGPSMASIPRINNIYYMQIIIKYKNIKTIYDSLIFISREYQKKKVKLEIDINPYHI